MSNPLAIAAVTAVLRELLNNGINSYNLSSLIGSNVTATAVPPDRIQLGGAEPAQLNLFLYHVTPNTGWSNVGLPSRDDRYTPLTNPPLALDLYYLLTAYGRVDFDSEILLGYAMQMLHETPVLLRGDIRTVLASQQAQKVKDADLADQIEQIKITPQTLNTEEISKLWTAMQAHYRTSAAYHASVVLIEGERPTRVPVPVALRNIQALPFRAPIIEEVVPAIARAGQVLTLRGRNLMAGHTQVRFGAPPLVDPVRVDGQTIEVRLPADLLAGVHTVQVVQQMDFGTPGDPHSGFESNVVPFVLAPRITTAAPITVRRGDTLTLDIDPAVGGTQRASLLLGDCSIAIPPRPGSGSTLRFPIPSDCPAGRFLVRVQIDGAQSQLDVDENRESPTFGRFTGTPEVTITT